MPTQVENEWVSATFLVDVSRYAHDVADKVASTGHRIELAVEDKAQHLLEIVTGHHEQPAKPAAHAPGPAHQESAHQEPAHHEHAPHTASHTVLKLGAEGEEVSDLQKLLHIPETGTFDKKTHDRVAEFQKMNGLKADGVAGPRTLTMLRDPKSHHGLTGGATSDWGGQDKPASWMATSDGMVELDGDDLVLFAVAGGETSLEGHTAIIGVTPAGGETVKAHVSIGPVQTKKTKTHGAIHTVTLENLPRVARLIAADPKPVLCAIEAVLEQKLGGAAWHGKAMVTPNQLDDGKQHLSKTNAHWLAHNGAAADMDGDDLLLFVVADDDHDLEGRPVTITLTPHGGATKKIRVGVGPVQTAKTKTQGPIHRVVVENVTTICPPPESGGQPVEYTVEAELAADAGGAKWKGKAMVEPTTGPARVVPHAHWLSKGSGTASVVDDDVVLFVVADADQNLQGEKIVMTVTPPGGSEMRFAAVVGGVNTPKTKTQGAVYGVEIANVMTSFPSPKPDARLEDYVFTATLPQALGGAHWSGKPV